MTQCTFCKREVEPEEIEMHEIWEDDVWYPICKTCVRVTELDMGK